MSTNNESSNFRNKIVVVTGGGSGIGKALCEAFARAGATVVVVDVRSTCQDVARSLPRRPLSSYHHHHCGRVCNVADPTQVQHMIRTVKNQYGRIDIYCSNAGIIFPPPATNTSTTTPLPLLMDDSVGRLSDQQWKTIMDVNVLSHVIAIRELVPDWQEGKGDGHFVITASAAGVLTQIGDASYGVSKAAAVSLAEHLAIAHSDCLSVHCLCPQAVQTPFIQEFDTASNAAMTDGIVTPHHVAECTLAALNHGDFWIFPHPRVKEYMKRKVMDHARWLKGMQSLRKKLLVVSKRTRTTNQKGGPPRSKL